ncbi:MGMT family protein [filamentous cyanobacterium LEGE 11480]|uniref:MGMT family protein n=1 Tax=Romeriopsis navalis LEGE 11480 TaxID=2777977 RepID=A0A928VSS8_9CYAN|nr:MGMT family protein [Romeriopsis navalis]MBE9032351.1 MGMT family protein [Romeriopsis navalis LEGE 11480]
MANSYDRIYAVVKQIPKGKVATYGQVAQLAGYVRGARLAGYALFRVTPEMDVPWQRVINAKGEISDSPFRQGSDYLQRSILEDEGIVFDQNDRISLTKYRWAPAPEDFPSMPSSTTDN